MKCYLCEKSLEEGEGTTKNRTKNVFCDECWEKVKDIRTMKEIDKIKKEQYSFIYTSFKCDICKKSVTSKMFNKSENSKIKCCESCHSKILKDKEEYKKELFDTIKKELDYYTQVTGNVIEETTRNSIYGTINRKYNTSDYTYGGMLFTIDYCKLKLNYGKFNEYIAPMIFNQYNNARDYCIERMKRRKNIKDFILEPEIISIKRKKGLNDYKDKKKYSMEEILNE